MLPVQFSSEVLARYITKNGFNVLLINAFPAKILGLEVTDYKALHPTNAETFSTVLHYKI